MYQRIMNKLDIDILAEELRDSVDDAVINRMKEQIAILDEAYGMHRGANNMGGYVLFFRDKESYTKSYDKIMNFYNLNKELFEYSDCIGEEGKNQYMEELYLLSSDDALVLIHPKED